MDDYSIDEGRQIVAAARNTIELFLRSPGFDKNIIKNSIKPIKQLNGIMVEIRHYPTGAMRGSGGFHVPIADPRELIMDAAIAAAFEDQRHVPISINELKHIVISVNLLSEPVHIKGGKTKRLSEVKQGIDGIMVEYGIKRGLVLPHEAVDAKWGKRQILEEACARAGIAREMWMQPMVKVYRFTCNSFSETEPEGIVRETLTIRG